MKNIQETLVELFKVGYCTPQIARIAKKLSQPSTTLHYNIKKLENMGAIKTYKAVFDFKKIDQGHCTYILISLAKEDYANPENVATSIANDSHVDSVDICTGDYEMLVKLRTKDIDEYYEWIKSKMAKYKFSKTVTMTSLKQLKTDFIAL